MKRFIDKLNRIIAHKNSITSIKQMDKKVGNLYDLGISELQHQNLDTAGKIFDKILKIYPDYVPALISKGICLQGKGNLKLALKFFDKALKIPNRDDYVYRPDMDGNTTAEIYLSMGISYQGLGNDEEAVKYFNKVLEINPAHTYALRYKSDILTYFPHF